MEKKTSDYEKVLMARDINRPHADTYIRELFDEFIELKGDRLGSDDESILGGLGLLGGIPVTIIAQRKGNDTEDNIKYNFGMTSPEGYRKAIRLMKQAEKFHRPVITLIDTPGAYPGKEAEMHGQANAIAESMAVMSGLKVPTIALIIGEGNSGGALALSVADRIWMVENAVFAILSPEGFASILWKDASRAAEACDAMKMTADKLYEYGFIDKVISEDRQIYKNLKKALVKELEKLFRYNREALISRRYEKFRNIDRAGKAERGV